jgi:hypothetical protein
MERSFQSQLLPFPPSFPPKRSRPSAARRETPPERRGPQSANSWRFPMWYPNCISNVAGMNDALAKAFKRLRSPTIRPLQRFTALSSPSPGQVTSTSPGNMAWVPFLLFQSSPIDWIFGLGGIQASPLDASDQDAGKGGHVLCHVGCSNPRHRVIPSG